MIFCFSLIMISNSYKIFCFHFFHSSNNHRHSRHHLFKSHFGINFHVKYNTLYFIFIKCVLCEAVGSADHNHRPFNTFLFFTRKTKETKKPALCHLSKGGFCSRARLKISKGQVVFFEKITQKISTFKPLPIFILSVLFSLPKARLSKNKIFIVFRFSSVTDKTTQK